MDIFDESKSAYAAELSRRDELRRALSIPMGIAVLVAGGLYSLIGSFSWEVSGYVLCTLFTLASLLASCGFGAAIYFMVRSYIGYEYAYVPTAKEIIEYKNDLIEYYEGKDHSSVQITGEIAEYLTGEYAKNAHQNALNNYSKSAYLHKANISLVFTILVLFLVGIVHLISRGV